MEHKLHEYANSANEANPIKHQVQFLKHDLDEWNVDILIRGSFSSPGDYRAYKGPGLVRYRLAFPGGTTPAGL